MADPHLRDRDTTKVAGSGARFRPQSQAAVFKCPKFLRPCTSSAFTTKVPEGCDWTKGFKFPTTLELRGGKSSNIGAGQPIGMRREITLIAPRIGVRMSRTRSLQMTCALMALQPAISGSQDAMNAVDGATIEQRIRISQPDEGRGRCKGSRASDRRKDFSRYTDAA